MTPEEIIEKAKSGEVTKEELDQAIDDLSPSEKIQFDKLAKEEAKNTLSSLSGLRKEKNRLETIIEERKTGSEPQTPAVDPMANFRNEQLLKAEIKFKQDFGLDDAEFENIKGTFARIDSGKIDSELIYKDFVGAYALHNSETLLDAQRRQQNMQKGAVAATVAAAGSSTANADPNAEPPKQFSDAAVALAQQAGITVEAAAKIEKEGFRRVY